MIKQVLHQKEYDKVCEYLVKQKLEKPNALFLLYSVNDKDEINGVIGVDCFPVIEPLAADSGAVANELYKLCMVKIANKEYIVDTGRVECYCTDEKKEKMERPLKFTGFKNIQKLNRYVKWLTQKEICSNSETP